MFRSVVVAFTLAVLATDVSAAEPNKLQGVWKVVEIRTEGPNATTNSNPQPGLYIFTAKHYSNVVVNSDKPRPDLPADLSKVTVAELQAVYGPFVAAAGTYELKGDSLTLRPMVGKNPNVMKPGFMFEIPIKLEDNSLSFTLLGMEGNAPIRRTIKFVRIE